MGNVISEIDYIHCLKYYIILYLRKNKNILKIKTGLELKNIIIKLFEKMETNVIKIKAGYNYVLTTFKRLKEVKTRIIFSNLS